MHSQTESHLQPGSCGPSFVKTWSCQPQFENWCASHCGLTVKVLGAEKRPKINVDSLMTLIMNILFDFYTRHNNYNEVEYSLYRLFMKIKGKVDYFSLWRS